MFLPQIHREIFRIGIRQPWFRQVEVVKRSGSLGIQAGMHTSSTVKPGVAPRIWKSLYGKRIFGAGAVASVGLGISAFTRPKVHCEAQTTNAGTTSPTELPPNPPQSSVSAYELGFGAVAGICAGVFVKKGAKALAFLFGGVFVLLQYLGSQSLLKVDWGRMSSRFEKLFYTRDATGNSKTPTVLSLWRWLVDFLTADFQPRASFVAGFGLGLRIG